MVDEQLVFARKASGLVRGLAFWDVVSMGMAYITPMLCIWYIIQVGLSLYPQANLVLAVIISMATVGWSGPLVWAILGGTMPRSGGDYIYSSRILNPWIAMGASFAMMCGGIYWTVFNAAVFADPALLILGQYMGWPGLVDFVHSKLGSCVLSLICLTIGLLIVVFAQSIFRKLAITAIIIMSAGIIITNIPLTFTSKAQFIANWDTQAAKNGSLGYQDFLAKAQEAGASTASTWNWHDTFGITAMVFFLFLWTFCIAYVGGEVKRPDKTLTKAHISAWLIPVALAIWAFVALGHIMDFSFLRAAAFQDFHGTVEGYNLPFSSSYMSLAFIASGGSAIVAFAASVSFMVTMAWLEMVELTVAQRILFAWGMDRMGPRWFTSVSARFGTPAGMYLFIYLIVAFLIVGYWYLFPTVLAGLVASGMQIISAFLLVSIGAIILPFRKKVAHIWQSSPFRDWKIFGAPVLTVAGVVYLGYVLALLYFQFFDPKTRDVNGRNFILLVVVWAAGIIWYLIWKSVSSRQGIDVASMTYKELPPE